MIFYFFIYYLLACSFEKFLKVSDNDIGINHLYCDSLLGYIWHCGLKYTGIKLQTHQDKDLILLLENIIQGGIISVMGDGCVKSDENKKIKYLDATNLYGPSRSQPLPFDEIKIEKKLLKRNVKYTRRY